MERTRAEAEKELKRIIQGDNPKPEVAVKILDKLTREASMKFHQNSLKARELDEKIKANQPK